MLGGPRGPKAAARAAGMARPAAMMVRETVDRAFATALAWATALSEGIRFERGLFHAAFAPRDQKDGMAAFIEKREPRFKHG